MLAMERFPLSQPPFSGHLSLSSPTIHSPRAGLPAPLIQGLPSPPAQHSSHHAAAVSHIPVSKVRPSSSSSLSSVHTPSPYGDNTLMGSTGSSVYSPTHTSSLPPQSSSKHQEQLGCHSSSTGDPCGHAMSMISLTGMMSRPHAVPISTAQDSSCSPGGSSVGSSRDHSSSPAGEIIICGEV